MLGGANIGVVIAGDDGDAIRRADAFQPCQRRRKLGFQREIDEIARDRNVVRRLRLHVRHQRIEHVAAVEFMAIAGPVEIAERALSGQLGKPRRRQWRKMRIGQMGQRKGRHRLRPSRIPVCNDGTIIP